MSPVAHDGRSVPHHRESDRPVEFARPLARRTELAHEVAGRVEHQDARARAGREAVDHVQIAVGIEGDRAHVREHLPVLAIDHPDPEDLLEVRVEGLVAAGEVDDFLDRVPRCRGKVARHIAAKFVQPDLPESRLVVHDLGQQRAIAECEHPPG